ncbi:MAG TPA: ArsI/CadI family heavy metal resistance metalloenzyme [Bacilli bacterium]|nr:ArsI/CadI family heavy metal resistance metalloenzyme [Bacilli bacterium]
MRMHVAINVKDLNASLDFYKKLFNAEPAKVKSDYAKFELTEPALHFSLNVRPYDTQRGVLNHFGLQVADTEAVLATKQRLQAAGLVALDEMNTTCCYAVQDKIWVRDPEGNAWEIFYTKEDAEFESADAADDRPDVCCLPTDAPDLITLD